MAQKVLRMMVEKAKAFTKKAFDSVKRFSGHSLRTGEILENEFSVNDEEIIAAGILHDVLEDTDVTVNDLTREFPSRVVQLVEAVSHEKDMTHEQRMNFQNRLLTISEDAKTVKLADQLDSLRWMLGVYEAGQQGEYPKFKDNDKYVSFLEKFHDSCGNKEAAAKVQDVVRKLARHL